MKYASLNNSHCFLKMAILLLSFPVAGYSQNSIAGKFNIEYKIFIPADTNIFVKRFNSSTSIFTYKDGISLSDGILSFSKSGLLDSTGKIIAGPVYDNIRTSDETIFIVKQNNKEGLIDKNGKHILEPSYESIGMFYDGIATVKNNFKFGYINNKGAEVVPLIYDITFDHNNGFLLVKKGRMLGLLNSKGDKLFPVAYPMIRPYGDFIIVMSPDKKQALYNRQAQQLLGFAYDGIEEVNDDSLVAVHLDRSSWLMNIYTKKQLSKKYDYVFAFSKLDSPGIYRVKQNGKEGLVNINDDLTTRRYYDRIGLFSEGLAPVTDNDKQGYIDATGKAAIPFIYDRVWKCQEGMCYVMYKGNKGFIDTHGKWQFAFNLEVDFFYNGFAKFYKNKKIGFINKKGETIAEAKYRWVENFKAGSAMVYTGNDIFYIDDDGNRIQ